MASSRRARASEQQQQQRGERHTSSRRSPSVKPTATAAATEASRELRQAPPSVEASTALPDLSDLVGDEPEGGGGTQPVADAAVGTAFATTGAGAGVDGGAVGNIRRIYAAGNSGGRRPAISRSPAFYHSPPTPNLREHFPTRFSSWDEFDAFLTELCAATFQVFRKRSSLTIVAHNKNLVKNHFPEEFEYYSKWYQCTHGVPRRSRGDGSRAHLATRDTGCLATIHATVLFDRQVRLYFIRVRVSGSHNHPVGKEQYFGYTENRRITDPALLHVIETMTARGEPPRAILPQIAAIVNERTGEECIYSLKDIRNEIYRVNNGKQGANREVQEGEEDVEAEAEDPSSGASSDSEEATDTGNRNKRRRVGDAIPTNAGDSVTAPLAAELFVSQRKAKVKLSRLLVLVDSSYCYEYIHKEIAQLDIATLELLPGTISGFKYDVTQLSPSDKPDDLDFVLPLYVTNGCVDGIIEYCQYRGLHPQYVGVKIAVQKPSLSFSSCETRVVTLSSRQLLIIKRFYLVRRNMADVKDVLEWIDSSDTLEGCQVAAPLDEYADYTKDLYALSLSLMPLSSTTVCGLFHTGENLSATMQFTDTIVGANILKFGGGSAENNIDLDCVKAALLSMTSRFQGRASFLNPDFVLEEVLAESCKKGSTYGAFLSPKVFVAGLVRLSSTRWGGAVLDCSRNVCYLYTSDAAEYAELERALKVLFIGYKLPDIGFEAPPPPSPSSIAPALLRQKNDSGILALLFVELMVQGKTWADLSNIESLDYFRARYMLQAIQVVSKQNIQDIRWH